MTRPLDLIKEAFGSQHCEWCRGSAGGWQCKNPQVKPKIKKQRFSTEPCTPEQWAAECPLHANKE